MMPRDSVYTLSGLDLRVEACGFNTSTKGYKLSSLGIISQSFGLDFVVIIT